MTYHGHPQTTAYLLILTITAKSFKGSAQGAIQLSERFLDVSYSYGKCLVVLAAMTL